MTAKEYNELLTKITTQNEYHHGTFQWELLKVLWEIRDALKGNLE